MSQPKIVKENALQKIKDLKEFKTLIGVLPKDLWGDGGVSFPTPLLTKFKKYKV